jgi:glucose-6-phosphate isomerase
MVSPRSRLTSVGLLLLAMKESFDEVTIGMSRGKAHYKPPFLAPQLSMFFALARYMMVNITRSSSEVVLRTTKYTVIYPGVCGRKPGTVHP